MVKSWSAFSQPSFWESSSRCSPICCVLCSVIRRQYSGCQDSQLYPIGFRWDCGDRTVGRQSSSPASSMFPYGRWPSWSSQDWCTWAQKYLEQSWTARWGASNCPETRSPCHIRRCCLDCRRRGRNCRRAYDCESGEPGAWDQQKSPP